MKEKKLDYRWTPDSLSNIKLFGKNMTGITEPSNPATAKYIKELKRQIAEEERKKQKSKSNT